MGVETSIFDNTLTTLDEIKDYLGGDVHENEEPVHNPTTDIDATWINKTKAGLAEVVRRIENRGDVYVSASDDTTITTHLDWYTLVATWTDVLAPVGFTRADGVFTYTEAETRLVRVSAVFTVAADFTQVYHFAIAKNGTKVDSMEHALGATATELYQVVLAGAVECSTDDTLEVVVTALTADGKKITTYTGTFSVF